MYIVNDKDLCSFDEFFSSNKFLSNQFDRDRLIFCLKDEIPFDQEVLNSDLHPLIKYVLICSRANCFYSFKNLYRRFKGFDFNEKDLYYLQTRYNFYPQSNIFYNCYNETISLFRECIFFYTMKEEDRNNIYGSMYKFFNDNDNDKEIIFSVVPHFYSIFSSLCYLNYDLDLSNYFMKIILDYAYGMSDSSNTYLGLLELFCLYTSSDYFHKKDCNGFLYLFKYYLDNYGDDKNWIWDLIKDIRGRKVIYCLLNSFSQCEGDSSFNLNKVFDIYRMCKMLEG